MTGAIASDAEARAVRIRSLRALRVLIVPLVGLAIVVWLIMLLPANMLVASNTYTPDHPMYDALVWSWTVVVWSEMAVFSVAFVLLLILVERAWRNLLAMGIRGLEWTSTEAAGGWLIPGVNLIRVPEVMRRLVGGSRAAAAGLSDWRAVPREGAVSIWWGAFVTGWLLYITGGLVTIIEPRGWWLAVGGDVAFMTAGIVTIILVVRVVRAQRHATSWRLRPPAPPGPPLVGSPPASHSSTA